MRAFESDEEWDESTHWHCDTQNNRVNINELKVVN